MIIVTGGAGFIGSVMVKLLNDKGHSDIIIVDHLGVDGKPWENFEGLKFSEKISANDFIKPEVLGRFKDASAIYHMGACSSTTEMNVEYLTKNNVEYSQSLFNFCAENQIPYIYASSAATYGDGELGYDDDHEKSAGLKPLNPYGQSKQDFDQWALKQEQTPPQWFGLKFFNVYGPQEYHKGSMKSVVYQAFQQIKDKGFVRLFKSHKEGYADGEQLRDFVYVKDVARAMYELSRVKDSNHNGLYNIGTGQARSFKDLVIATFKALGLEPKIEYFDMPEHLQKQYQYYTQANMQKLNSLLPDFKFSSLEEGVTDYVLKHLNTDNPYFSNEVIFD